MTTILASLLFAILGVAGGYFVRHSAAMKDQKSREGKGDEIIEKAKKSADEIKYKARKEAKEIIHEEREVFEKELRKRENDMRSQEKQVDHKEAKLESKLEDIEKETKRLQTLEEDLKEARGRVEKEIEKFKKELPEQEIISLPSEQDKTESGEEKGHVCESLLQVELFKILSEGRKDVKNSAFNYFSAENNSENDFEEAWEIYEIGLGKVRSKEIVPEQYSAKNLHEFIPHTDTKKILDAYGNVFARNLLTYVYNIYLAENSIYRLLANNKKIFDELDESIKEGIEERLTSWQFNWSECAKLFKNKTKEEDENKGGKPLAPSGSKMQSLKHSSPAFVEKVEGEKEEFDNEFGNTQIGKRTLSAWQGFAKNSERKADRNTYSAFYNEVTNNLKNKMAETAFMKKLMQISEYFLKIDLNTPDKFFHNSPEINYPAKIRYEIKNGKKTIYCLNQTTHENAKITPDLLSKRNDNLYNYLCINLARIINFEKFKKVLAEIRIEQMPIGMSFKISEEEKKDYTRIIREALADLIRKNKFVKEILYLDSIHIIWEENYVFYNKNVLNIGFRHFEPPFDYALFKELIVEAFENPEKKAGYNEKSIMEKVEDAVEGLNQEK